MRKLLAWPLNRKLLLAEAVICLLIGRFVAIIPLSRWAGRLGTMQEETPMEDDPLRVQQVRNIGGMVRTAAEYVPWRSDCLPQALAAHLMLQRRKIPGTLYLGVMKVSQNGQVELKAHAWIRSGTVILTGGRTRRRFNVVSTFARWYA